MKSGAVEKWTARLRRSPIDTIVGEAEHVVSPARQADPACCLGRQAADDEHILESRPEGQRKRERETLGSEVLERNQVVQGTLIGVDHALPPDPERLFGNDLSVRKQEIG